MGYPPGGVPPLGRAKMTFFGGTPILEVKTGFLECFWGVFDLFLMVFEVKMTLLRGKNDLF